MTTALIWIGCVLGYAAGYSITARVYVATSYDKHPSDVRFDATVVGLIWPLVLTIVAVGYLLSLPTRGAKTRTQREDEELARRRAEQRQQRQLAARTRELEAENERLKELQEWGRNV